MDVHIQLESRLARRDQRSISDPRPFETVSVGPTILWCFLALIQSRATVMMQVGRLNSLIRHADRKN